MSKTQARKKQPASSAAAAVPQHVVVPDVAAVMAQSDEASAHKQKIAELEKSALIFEARAQVAEQKSARLQQQLDGAGETVSALRAELGSLKETYRCVGPGTMALARRFDALRKRAPWLMSPLSSVLRSLS